MITGSVFVHICMEYSTAPEKWPTWFRKFMYCTIPFSFIIQLIGIVLSLIVAWIGGGSIGIFWTFSRFLRLHYSEEKVK